MKWFSNNKLSPEAQTYIDATPSRLNRKTPIDELRYVVIDAETTGFDVNRDRLLSLAAVPLKAREISIADVHSWLIFQPAPGVTEAARIHCILPSDTRAGLPEAQVMEELLPLLHGTIVVGHHIQFDAALIGHAFRRRFNVEFRNPLLDTAELAQVAVEAFARTGYANQHPPTLDEICSHLEIATMERHTAPGDAFTTAELFLLLCARLRQRLKRPLLVGDLPFKWR